MARFLRIVKDPQADPPDVAVYQGTHVQQVASCRDAGTVTGSARKQSEVVNGLQKTPLESYFY